MVPFQGHHNKLLLDARGVCEPWSKDVSSTHSQATWNSLQYSHVYHQDDMMWAKWWKDALVYIGTQPLLQQSLRFMSYLDTVWFSWRDEWCQQEEQQLQQKEGVQEDPTFMKCAASPCGFGPSAACSRRSRLRTAVGGTNFLCRRPSLLLMKQTNIDELNVFHFPDGYILIHIVCCWLFSSCQSLDKSAAK